MRSWEEPWGVWMCGGLAATIVGNGHFATNDKLLGVSPLWAWRVCGAFAGHAVCPGLVGCRATYEVSQEEHLPGNCLPLLQSFLRLRPTDTTLFAARLV